MVRTALFFSRGALATLVLGGSVVVSACSVGEIPVGSTGSSEQELKKNKDGSSTGNGTTCWWDGPDTPVDDTPVPPGDPDKPVPPGDPGSDNPGDPGSDNPGDPGSDNPGDPGDNPGNPGTDNPGSASGPAPGKGSSGGGTATTKVGDSFPSPDGCNTCFCTSAGVACTRRACPPPVACPADAKECPDGSYVGRVGPKCEFAECPAAPPVACPADVKQCPDGSYVGRTGPKCTFGECPAAPPVACPADAKQCPDGSYVSRTGPNCEFAPCP